MGLEPAEPTAPAISTPAVEQGAGSPTVIGTSAGHDTVTVTDTVKYRPGLVVESYDSCFGQSRWRNGVLEQLWHIHHIGTTGAIERIEDEWRPVPHVTDNEGSK